MTKVYKSIKQMNKPNGKAFRIAKKLLLIKVTIKVKYRIYRTYITVVCSLPSNFPAARMAIIWWVVQ